MSATLEVKHKMLCSASTWMGDHLGTVVSWSADHCGVTGQCKDSGVGNRRIHLFLCNGKRCLCALRTPAVKQSTIFHINSMEFLVNIKLTVFNSFQP